MDPYEFARHQGQVLGSSLPDQPEDPFVPEDLLDLLLHAFLTRAHIAMGGEERAAVGRFAQFANDYLAEHRVVSTGIVDGAFSLVFESGQTVPLASTEPLPVRPDATIPITRPKDSKMHGMPVVDNSVPVTTGQVGSPTRSPR